MKLINDIINFVIGSRQEVVRKSSVIGSHQLNDSNLQITYKSRKKGDEVISRCLSWT